MTDRIKVFFLQPTKLYVRSLRRAIDGDVQSCRVAKPYSWCVAAIVIDSVVCEEAPTSGHIEWPRDDPRWPQACAQCGEPFKPSDWWLVDHDLVYRRLDTGDECTLRSAPAGACWDADWLHDHPAYVGPDGRCLIVRLPDGRDWMIDSRAKNCTLPDDKVHKCWIRHGRPEDGTLHVDKQGVTCAAGDGSIATAGYHGFLHGGYLVRC
jgi:hypothetical protein